MDVLHERCAGFDVHQETVVCCLLVGTAGTRCRKEFRTFGTMTADLEALRDWLKACGVTHVAMESTGVFWKPVYAVLEGHVQIVVGNAQHIRNVPGRKTDIKDAEWIAQLLRHGLIRASFVPPPPFRGFRQGSRQRPWPAKVGPAIAAPLISWAGGDVVHRVRVTGRDGAARAHPLRWPSSGSRRRNLTWGYWCQGGI